MAGFIVLGLGHDPRIHTDLDPSKSAQTDWPLTYNEQPPLDTDNSTELDVLDFAIVLLFFILELLG